MSDSAANPIATDDTPPPANPRPTVAVCYPSGDMVHANFALCLANLCMFSSWSGFTIHVVNTKSSIVAVARNNAVKRAQELKADHMLFLDSDMKFPRQTLIDLIGHAKPVAGATYCRRTSPYMPLGERLAGGRVEQDGRLIEMRHLPTGCMLIRMDVFDNLPKPYFRFEVDEAAGSVRGEDYVFCERAIQAGHSVWCDLRLSVDIGHIGQKEYRLEADALPAPAAG